MSLELYAHPFSSYCQKVLVALYENATPFEYRMLDNDAAMTSLRALWPLGKFPLLVDDGQPVAEASIIVEHLALHHPGPVQLVPRDPVAALPVRAMDRVFDNYAQTPMQAIVSDAMRPLEGRDASAVAAARATLETAYAWLDTKLQGQEWAAGSFSLADCAAAPALFYSDWVQPIDPSFANLTAYRRRLLARPSMARAVEEARPFRGFFPPGAPDRD